MTCASSVEVDTVNMQGDPAVLEADRAALAEVAWVSREALAPAREGVRQDDPRRAGFLARKRAVLDYIEAQGTS